jgi:DNA-binding response OmpR family regulator
MATKLLIVDDEPFTVDMLETFLQLNGFETVGAFNGEDGLVLVQVERPEIVILDLMLPDIEGYEVCQRLRSQPQSASLPVLVLSARAESASKEKAMAAGADAYMVKPVQFPVLLSELNRLLQSRKTQTAPAQNTPPAQRAAPVTPIPSASPPVPGSPQPFSPEAQSQPSQMPTQADPPQPAKPHLMRSLRSRLFRRGS